MMTEYYGKSSVALSAYRDQRFKVCSLFVLLHSSHPRCPQHSQQWGLLLATVSKAWPWPWVEQGGMADQERALATSATLYIGNLGYYTTEEQIHELFSRAGDVKRVIMGLDRFKKTPCGFCFVE